VSRPLGSLVALILHRRDGVAPEIERAQPAYVQILEALRQQIIDGDLADGASIPSVRELADTWHVSRATVEKALSALQAEGLTHAVPGRGTYVSARMVGHSPQDRHRRAQRKGKVYPDNQYARIIAAELLPAPTHVAEALRIVEGTPVIRRQRITYRDDVPVSVSTSWFPGAFADTAPELLTPERMPGGTADYVAEKTGLTATHGHDQVAAQHASAEVAASLAIEEGSAVLAGRNWLYTDGGDVVEYGEYFHPADRWSSYDYSMRD
jgi:DNA-binding GntR family transcriptional regulator